MPVQPSDTNNEDRLRRGIAFKVEGNYDAALAELKAVLEADPKSATAHRELGLVLGFTGFFDESLEELRVSVQLDPAELDARNDLAAHSGIRLPGRSQQRLQGFIAMDGPQHPGCIKPYSCASRMFLARYSSLSREKRSASADSWRARRYCSSITSEPSPGSSASRPWPTTLGATAAS